MVGPRWVCRLLPLPLAYMGTLQSDSRVHRSGKSFALNNRWSASVVVLSDGAAVSGLRNSSRQRP